MKLVISIARRFRGRGLPLADLIQEGTIGLDHAARKFDPDKGFKFSTYASWWIRQAVQRGLAKGGGNQIRVPDQVATRRARARAVLRDNPDMHIDELSTAIGETAVHVEQALEAAEVVTSLDRTLFDGDGGRTLLDSMPDPNAEDPSEILPIEVQNIRTALELLPDLQHRVIELRFGFGGERALSFGEIAELLGESTSTIQAVQRQGLNALRSKMIEFV